MLNNQKSIYTLTAKQEEAMQYIIRHINKFPLIEAPTGFGKTLVLLSSAIKLQEQGYTVIISTPNNKLTIDAYREACNYYSNKNINFAIGVSNYIDISKLNSCKNNGILEKYLDINSLIEWEKTREDGEELMIDNFNDIVVFYDIAYQELVAGLICKTKREKTSFEAGSITYTNHFYLLSATRNISNEDMEDVVILVDEVHELPAVADVIYQNSFSPFFLKNTIGGLLGEVKLSKDNFTGKKSLEKELSSVYGQLSIEFSKIMNLRSASRVGENDNIHKTEYLKSLNSINSEALKSVSARIAKLLAKQEFAIKHKSIASAILNENRELKGVIDSIANGNGVDVFLSPSKGYPTYKSNKGIISALLKNFLWGRVAGMAGVSATLNTTINISDHINKKFAYSRLGLNPSISPEIKTFSREFPKESVKLINKPINLYNFDYESNEEGADSDLIRWSNEIAEHVKDSFDSKNSMILAGSFKEVEYITMALSRLGLDNITTASNKEKTSSIVNKFVKNGGILVGTRNFGTGLSLNGHLLERLYIVKIPYPQITNIKWIKLKEFNEASFWSNLNNEMIMQLRQFFGRLQRTKSDIGEIHLLDARGIKDENKKRSKSIVSKVHHYMSEYGIFDKAKSATIVTPNVEKYLCGAEYSRIDEDDDDLF